MDDPFGLLIIVLIAGSFLWRVVSGMLRGGSPSRPRGPSGDEQYADLRRRVEQRRREMEETRERMEMELPAPGESYADLQRQADEPQWRIEEAQPDGNVAWEAPDLPPPLPVLGPEVAGPLQPTEPSADGAPTPKAAALSRAAGRRGPASSFLVTRRNLRRAIVAHEILGPPKGLRDPEDEGP